jgi:hypothetical protein
MNLNGSSLRPSDISRLLKREQSMTQIVTTGLINVAWNLWFAGGNLAFITAFITGKQFWPAVGAFFQSWWYLWKYTHGAS